MDHKIHSNLITKESLEGTIRRDPTSAYWFSEIMGIQAMDKLFPYSDPLSRDRNSLKKVMFIRRFLYFAVIPLLLCLFLLTRYVEIIYANAALVVVILLLEHVKVGKTAGLAWMLINKEFTKDELCRLTYYQLTEKLGKKYGFPTLVDTVVRWDWTLRTWLLATYVICSMILFFKLAQVTVIIAVVFLLIIAFLRFFRPA